jgi:hypothetical protein
MPINANIQDTGHRVTWAPQKRTRNPHPAPVLKASSPELPIAPRAQSVDVPSKRGSHSGEITSPGHTAVHRTAPRRPREIARTAAAAAAAVTAGARLRVDPCTAHQYIHPASKRFWCQQRPRHLRYLHKCAASGRLPRACRQPSLARSPARPPRFGLGRSQVQHRGCARHGVVNEGAGDGHKLAGDELDGLLRRHAAHERRDHV